MKRNVILKGNENKNFLEKCKEKMNELIEQRKQQEKEMEAEALARRAAKNKSKQKRLQMNKTAQTQARLTSGEFEIVPTKDSGKNVLKRIDCDEVKELPCCDNEQFTTNEESRRDRKLRLNRERKRRWLSRQSEEKLAALRAQDARAARKRRQEKVKLLQQMEINSTKGLND